MHMENVNKVVMIKDITALGDTHKNIHILAYAINTKIISKSSSITLNRDNKMVELNYPIYKVRYRMDLH